MNCSRNCLHCDCGAKAQDMEETLLAGEVTTKEFWICWFENAKHNAVEDLGHPGREIPYHERLGRAEPSDLITWKSIVWDFLGTVESRGKRTEASLRETIVDAEAVASGDPDA